MEITNKVIKHPKSQMTSVTDNVIKNRLVDERCASFRACNRACIDRCSSLVTSQLDFNACTSLYFMFVAD